MSATTRRGLRAGFGKVELSSSAVIGADLVGYGNRAAGAVAVHDPLFARAVVLAAGDQRVAVCGVDLCHVGEDVVAAARDRLAAQAGLAPHAVFIAASHTHSGPADNDPACWPDGLDALITQAVLQACRRLRPATVGAGWGMLHGHCLNRRRLEDPVDPAVMVIRVDDAAGRPLGVCYGFGCHPVVLGPDNRQVSADWPGSCSRCVEAQLGPDAVAVFVQGASGDVNPATAGVHRLLGHGISIIGEAHAARYYAPAGDPRPLREIGDRTGGTFAEADHLGHALAGEVLGVHCGIAGHTGGVLWTRQIPIAASGAAYADPPGRHARPRVRPGTPLEIMLVGIDGPDIVLVGQPGEVFTATGAGLRRDLRHAGVAHPFVVGHANGRRGYLPPRQAFPDGGYEVDWARATGMPEGLQDDIRAEVLRAVTSRLTGPRPAAAPA